MLAGRFSKCTSHMLLSIKQYHCEYCWASSCKTKTRHPKEVTFFTLEYLLPPMKTSAHKNPYTRMYIIHNDTKLEEIHLSIKRKIGIQIIKCMMEYYSAIKTTEQPLVTTAQMILRTIIFSERRQTQKTHHMVLFISSSMPGQMNPGNRNDEGVQGLCISAHQCALHLCQYDWHSRAQGRGHLREHSKYIRTHKKTHDKHNEPRHRDIRTWCCH